MSPDRAASDAGGRPAGLTSATGGGACSAEVIPTRAGAPKPSCSNGWTSCRSTQRERHGAARACPRRGTAGRARPRPRYSSRKGRETEVGLQGREALSAASPSESPSEIAGGATLPSAAPMPLVPTSRATPLDAAPTAKWNCRARGREGRRSVHRGAVGEAGGSLRVEPGWPAS
jgi:hypothetical protein